MERSYFKIKSGTGSHSTLDKAYNKLIIDALINGDKDRLERWEVYNYITSEFIKIGKINYFNEFKYRVTDGEDPNIVALDIISSSEQAKSSLWFMVRKIEEWIDDDLISRFCD